MKYLITGGAGFIGSELIRTIYNERSHSILNIDKLTYASNEQSLSSIDDSSRYTFKQIDICNYLEMKEAYNNYEPDVVFHLAAESHVDKSIENPVNFINTNIIGTYNLLEIIREHHNREAKSNNLSKFIHISTDEVFGDLKHPDDKDFPKDDPPLFKEMSRYNPSSPYSASKASSDLLVKAWHRTFNLPTIITNCSNNYGPYQNSEKLIPLTISNALNGKRIPIYGDGSQIRDWLYVSDHVDALIALANDGAIGENYNIGGFNEIRNIDVIKTICNVLDQYYPAKINKKCNISKYEELLSYVEDRPGHDRRYAIDSSKISQSINWKPKEDFASGIKKTVLWYLEEFKKEGL